MSEVHVPLPGSWVKTFSQRKSGTTMGGWDVYMKPPVGKRVRSNPELIKYCKEKEVKIDPGVINLATVLPKDHREFRSTKQFSRLSDELGPLVTMMSPSDLAEVESMDPELEERLKDIKARGTQRGGDGGNIKRPRRMVPLSVAQSGGKPLKRMVGRKSTKGARPQFDFSRKQLKYLNRQFQKVPAPSFDQITYLAKQLTVPTQDVQVWYQNKSRETQRPLQNFDVIEAADCDEEMSAQDRMLSKEELYLGGEAIVVETDNADFDIGVVAEEKEGEEASNGLAEMDFGGDSHGGQVAADGDH